MKTKEEIKAMSLREFVFFLNSLTTTELIRQFPHRFHLLSGSDSVQESSTKLLANDAILWDMVKDKAKEDYNNKMLPYRENIGKKVRKGSITEKIVNRNPFKSGFLTNTIKDVVMHDLIDEPAYTFIEDESQVECRRCIIVDENCEHPLHNRQKGNRCGNCGEYLPTT